MPFCKMSQSSFRHSDRLTCWIGLEVAKMGTKNIVVLFFLFFCALTLAECTDLPTRAFLPSHYDIELRVILEDGEPSGEKYTAPGVTHILGVIQAPTSKLELYAYQLDIDKKSVTVKTKFGSESVNVTEVNTDYSGNLAILLERELGVGEELEVSINSVAQIKPWSGGLVQSKYLTESGEERRLAATRFYDELDERPFFEVWRAFPCVDERQIWPDKRVPVNPKSTFDLTIIRKNNYTSLANTELVTSIPDPKYRGWILDKYARTIKITPSMVSLLVSDFSHVESSTTANKAVRVHAPQNLLKDGSGEYAAKVGSKLLDFFESYFNSTFPLSKMDFVVVPDFFRSVESWGLSFFPKEGKDDVLLLTKNDSSSESNFFVDGTIAQSLARQWVGPWWNEMYLNRGIVEYLKYIGMEAADPSMPSVETSYLKAVQSSFASDTSGSYLGNLTLGGTLWKPEMVTSRGATLLRMAEGFLPSGTVQRALQTYVKQVNEQEENPNHEEFFQMLQEAAGSEDRNVSGFMHSWCDQFGYPLVKVQVANESFVKLSQERFKVSDEEYLNENASWQIPITLLNAEESQLWLEEDGASKSFQHDFSKWFMINRDARGYYRSLYDESLLKLIQQQMEKDSSVINKLSRAQLLDDYFIFMEKNYTDIQTVLNLTRYLGQETEYVAWRVVLNHFEVFDRRFSSHSGYPLFQKYLQKRLDSSLSSIGVEDSIQESLLKKSLRSDLLRWACTKGDPSPLCISEAKKLLEGWKSNGISSSTSPLSQSLSCAAVAKGGQEAFDILFNRYETLANANGTKEERQNILRPLTCATDKEILEGLYNTTVNQTSTLMQMKDGKFVLESLVNNPQGRLQLLPFLYKNVDQVLDLYNPYNKLRPTRVKRTKFIRHEGAELVENLLTSASNYYSTQEQLDEISTFANENKNKLLGSYVNIQTTLGWRKSNVEWMNTTGKLILEWLQSVDA